MTSGEGENLNLNRPQSPLKGFMALTQRGRSGDCKELSQTPSPEQGEEFGSHQ